MRLEKPGAVDGNKERVISGYVNRKSVRVDPVRFQNAGVLASSDGIPGDVSLLVTWLVLDGPTLLKHFPSAVPMAVAQLETILQSQGLISISFFSDTCLQ